MSATLTMFAAMAAALAHTLAAVVAALCTVGLSQGALAPSSAVTGGQAHRREAGYGKHASGDSRGNLSREFHLQHPQLLVSSKT